MAKQKGSKIKLEEKRRNKQESKEVEKYDEIKAKKIIEIHE